jgi:hypothetical protein
MAYVRIFEGTRDNTHLNLFCMFRQQFTAFLKHAV